MTRGGAKRHQEAPLLKVPPNPAGTASRDWLQVSLAWPEGLRQKSFGGAMAAEDHAYLLQSSLWDGGYEMRTIFRWKAGHCGTAFWLASPLGFHWNPSDYPKSFWMIRFSNSPALKIIRDFGAGHKTTESRNPEC